MLWPRPAASASQRGGQVGGAGRQPFINYQGISGPAAQFFDVGQQQGVGGEAVRSAAAATVQPAARPIPLPGAGTVALIAVCNLATSAPQPDVRSEPTLCSQVALCSELDLAHRSRDEFGGVQESYEPMVVSGMICLRLGLSQYRIGATHIAPL